MNKLLNLKPRRVDVQVSLFTACAVVLSCLCIYIVSYIITYDNILENLCQRSYSIYYYLENKIDQSIFFDINDKEDMQKDAYIRMQQQIEEIRQVTGVQRLYTAKRNQAGQFIYGIDGSRESDSDFRYPGDPIEQELLPQLKQALSGKQVLPKDIIHSKQGDILIAYLPIHGSNNAIVGAIGIEFSAFHLCGTYSLLDWCVPLVIVLSCLLCFLFAFWFFRRISNPFFQDLVNTDILTGLKNRNAYETDTKNLSAQNYTNGTGLILADLNGLKRVNDTLGHAVGDLYIKTLADTLRKTRTGQEVLYRLGGDEFVILCPDSDESSLTDFIHRAQKTFASLCDPKFPFASCSFGFAIYSQGTLESLEETYQRADENMYKNKKAFYENLNQI